MNSVALYWSSDEDEYVRKQELIRIRRNIRRKSNPLDLPDAKFKMFFRMSKEAFVYLLNETKNCIPETKSSSSVPLVLKLAAALRFLAESGYQKGVGNDFNLGVAQPTFSKILTEMLDIIETHVCPQRVKSEYTEQEKDQAKLYFFEKAGIPGIIGCVDGTHIRIVAPNKTEQHLYYNRKGYYSLNAMIVCDHRMFIRHVDARYPGASHDSFVWNSSEIRRLLQRNYQSGERNTWLLGDAGYPLEPFLITPYRSAEEGTNESYFNRKHSQARNIIERTIGVLKNRFRCLLGARQLHYKPEKSTQIVNVCAALHNICLHYRLDLEEDANVVDSSNDSNSNIIAINPSTNDDQVAANIRNQLLNVI